VALEGWLTGRRVQASTTICVRVRGACAGVHTGPPPQKSTKGCPWSPLCPALAPHSAELDAQATTAAAPDAAASPSSPPPPYPPPLLLAYPNSGEQWDGGGRCWHSAADDIAAPDRFAAAAAGWVRSPRIRLAAVGGCCRTGPGHIAALRAALQGDGQGVGS
jgi:hypothetical protein